MNFRLFLLRQDFSGESYRLVVSCISVLLFLVGCQQEGGAFSLGQDTLYTDSFTAGETGEWDVEGDAVGSASLENDQLTIAITGANVLHYATLEEPQFSDFALEVDATLLSGSASDTYGILFRLQEQGQQPDAVSFYRFAVTASGEYILERHHSGGTWTRLTDGWRNSDAIQQGVGAVNKLQVIAGGSSFSIFVNGTPLGRYNDPNPLPQGKIAVDAASYGPSDLLVAFDNLVIRSP